MKLRKLFITAGAALTIGLGVAASLSVNKSDDKVEASAATSGTISIDLTGGDWAENEGGQNFSVYFFNNSESKSGWGSYETASYQQYAVFIDYDLDFTPAGMIAVRYSNWYGESNWSSDPWCESSAWAKWNQTIDLDFVSNGNIIIDSWDEGEGKNTAYANFPYVHGQNSGSSWSWTTLVTLNSVKLNGSNHIEYFAEMSMTAGWNEYGVKILSSWDQWYGGTVTTVSDYANDGYWNLSGNNIIRTDGAPALTIRLYFDRNGGSIYITEPTHADADEWAQIFLGVSSSSNTCTYTKSNWSSSETKYSSLSSGVKNLFVNEAHVSHDAETSTYYAAAVQRYDYVLEIYGVYNKTTNPNGFTDFMGRVAAGKVNPKSSSIINPIVGETGSQTALAMVVIISISSLAIGGYFFLKKRKED